MLKCFLIILITISIFIKLSFCQDVKYGFITVYVDDFKNKDNFGFSKHFTLLSNVFSYKDNLKDDLLNFYKKDIRQIVKTKFENDYNIDTIIILPLPSTPNTNIFDSIAVENIKKYYMNFDPEKSFTFDLVMNYREGETQQYEGIDSIDYSGNNNKSQIIDSIEIPNSKVGDCEELQKFRDKDLYAIWEESFENSTQIYSNVRTLESLKVNLHDQINHLEIVEMGYAISSGFIMAFNTVYSVLNLIYSLTKPNIVNVYEDPKDAFKKKFEEVIVSSANSGNEYLKNSTKELISKNIKNTEYKSFETELSDMILDFFNVKKELDVLVVAKDVIKKMKSLLDSIIYSLNRSQSKLTRELVKLNMIESIKLSIDEHCSKQRLK